VSWTCWRGGARAPSKPHRACERKGVAIAAGAAGRQPAARRRHRLEPAPGQSRESSGSTAYPLEISAGFFVENRTNAMVCGLLALVAGQPFLYKGRTIPEHRQISN
jgi:hypothetical protein